MHLILRTAKNEPHHIVLMGKYLNIVTFNLSCRLRGLCVLIIGVLKYWRHGVMEITPKRYINTLLVPIALSLDRAKVFFGPYRKVTIY
jgi:hypothetical protein